MTSAEESPAHEFLHQPQPNEDHVSAEVKTHIRVTREQAEAFKELPEELQSKLGPPVYGQVMSAAALRRLARHKLPTVASTVMCPW